MLSRFLKQRTMAPVQVMAQQRVAPFSNIFGNHRDEQDNMDETPFEFTDESYEAINQLLPKYPDNYKCSAVIPVLFIAQKQNNNFLTLSAMHKTAKILEMTPMQVYEVASFYTKNREFLPCLTDRELASIICRCAVLHPACFVE